MGLIITEIREFVQFSPSKCFKDLAQVIENTRREGDKDCSKQILALKKLLGNSFYSSSLLQKELHRNVTYHQNDTINQAINNSFFPNLYEMKSLKRQITQTLPCQIALNVYFLTILHMLKVYNFF